LLREARALAPTPPSDARVTVNVARSHRARRVSAAQLARGPTSFVASGGVVTETRDDDDGATVRATRAARGGSAGANDIARARPRARERARERGRNARGSAARGGPAPRTTARAAAETLWNVFSIYNDSGATDSGAW
jgi:hypothetical protein